MASDFYTDDKGRVRPIEGKRKGGAAALIVVAFVALTAGGAGGAAAIGGGAGAGSGASVSSGPSARSGSQARQQRVATVRQRLERRGFQVRSRFDSTDNCFAHSYGRVRDFFRKHPCTSLHRALFEVRDARGGLVLVAVAWVEMPDAIAAREFHELVDTHGTGNVTELSREVWRYRNVRFTGEHYVSRRDGATVVNAQAEPVGRAAVAAELAEILTESLDR